MKYVAIMGAFALLLVGIAYYLIFYIPSDVKERIEDQQGVVKEVETEAGSEDDQLLVGVGTLDSLRLLDRNLECSFSYADGEATQVVGTYFVSGGEMRGDFLTESPDLTGQVLTSVIIKEATLFLWSEIEGETYGMKAGLGEVSNSGADSKLPVPLDADVSYDCKRWNNVDPSVFNPPTDVLFQDMSELMNAGMEYGTVYEESAEMP